MGTFLVGLVFAAMLLWAGRKAYADMKKSKCGGCSSCSYAKKKDGCQLEDHEPALTVSKNT